MTLRFARPGALVASMGDNQGAMALQQHQLTGARAPEAAPIEALSRPMADDPEPMRQLAGEVASPAAPVMPQPRTQTADTPQQLDERLRFTSTNRQMDQAMVDAANAEHLASAVAPAQASQRLMDGARAASAGYQQPDLTGAVADQQAAMAEAFAGDYRWGLMDPRQQQVVNGAIERLAQPPQVMAVRPGGAA